MHRNPYDPQGPYDPHGRPYDQQGRPAYDPQGRPYDPQQGPYDPQGRPYDGYDPYGEQWQGYGPDQGHRPPGSRFSAGRLWAGGAIVALVAALAAVVVMLLVRGVLDIPVFAPEKDGALVLATGGSLAAGAAAAALVGTAVLHLLLLATPRPEGFLAWIVGLATVAVVLLPFTSQASWESKAGTAGVYLVLGLVIGSLLTTVSRSARND